jgi:hypothetical protein
MDRVCAIVFQFQVSINKRDADIREFTPTSWRSIIGVVPQVCHGFILKCSGLSSVLLRILYCLLEP